MLLLIGSFLAALKCIFVSLQMDEEYAVSMSYRLLLGDRLFTQIWDPHQTSAFLMEFLMWIYLKLFHTTTYIVIWVRLAGVLIQLAIACYLYRMLCYLLEPEYSFYLAIIYFNLLPKTYVMPEFSNMMAWGLTMLLLSLFRLAILQGRISSGELSLLENCAAADKSSLREEKKSGSYIAVIKDTLQAERKQKLKIIFTAAEAGLWLSFVALAYPTCLLLFPFVIWYLWKYDAHRKKTIALFGATCFAAGGLYMAYLFSYMSVAELIANIRSLIASCASHSGGIQKRLGIYGMDFLRLLLFSLGYVLAAVLICGGVNWIKRHVRGKNAKAAVKNGAGMGYFISRIRQGSEENRLSFFYILLMISFILQFAHWILMLWEYEYSYPYTVYFLMFAIAFFYLGKLQGEKKEVAVLWLGANVVMFIAVLLLTNLTLFTSVKYLLTGVIMCAAVLIFYTKEKQPKIFQKYTGWFLIVWGFKQTFGFFQPGTH